MSKEILVPDIGDFDAVDVIEILVSVGDTVSVDDPLITLESDKASMDIPTPEGGVIQEIKVAVGDSVSEGSLVVLLAGSDEPSVNVATDDATPKVSSGAASAGGGTSIEDIHVPDIGDFDSVDVIEVLVAEGDTVAEEDSLITLESDKASMDIPSPKAGVVKSLKVVVGDSVSKGSVILALEVVGEGSTPATSETAAAAPAPAAAPAASASAVDGEAFKRVHASPSVRRIARELTVDLAALTATGPFGRVTEEDVRAFKDGTGRFANAASPVIATGEGLPVITQPDWSKFGEISEIPMKRIQKLSAKHLTKVILNVPQVTHFDEADITELEAYRQSMKEQAKAQGFGFTPLVFMMKAVAAALKEFPKFNSAMDDAGENFIQRHYYNIGIAVDTPDGLVVPVIRDVDRKGMFELARELGEVSKRAREGELKPADMSGGCFTISSLGGIGGTNFTPLVNAPEVGILGLTRAQSRLVRKDDEIVDVLMQPLAVTYDHRVIDGAYAARFASHLVFRLSDVRNLSL